MKLRRCVKQWCLALLFALFCLNLSSPQVAVAQEGPSMGAWIWAHGKQGNQDKPAYLRTTFRVGGSVESAVVCASGDNEFTLFLNGKRVLAGTAWERLERADVKSALQPGENTIAVLAKNRGGIAAFMAHLRWTTVDGEEGEIKSDGNWSSTSNDPGEAWQTSPLNGSWKPARVMGRVGERSLPWTGAINANVVAAALLMGDPSKPMEMMPQVDESIQSLEGFVVEKVFSVPRELGSWVALTQDGEDGLYASDQGGAGLFRIQPGASGEPTKVTKLPVDLSGAQGLLWAFDSLYVMINGGPKSGLHRAYDSDGDGELDASERLMFVPGGGEHGPHAIVLSPDGKSLFVCGGNHTALPKELAGSRIPITWQEDLLLPRRWDANGHAAGILAPGGWICEVDPAGKQWRVHSVGYRNQYDIAFNADGELFSYDADMEWDLGTPWYRPTRVVHATSGSEFGWRSGTGKWPKYFEDSLPPAVEIGPGSPVGITFGYGAKFPAKYQRALFILDWTYSTIYAVHLQPDGSTYAGEKEDFVTGQPLQVTDAAVAADGHLYFAVGGRGTQSALYRVRYAGDADVQSVNAKQATGQDLRNQRHALERWHGAPAESEQALDLILANLSNTDRFTRYAARLALEWQPQETWIDNLEDLREPLAKINGVIALCRQALPPQEEGREANGIPEDNEDRETAIELLSSLTWNQLSEEEQLALLRAYQLTFARLGAPNARQREQVLMHLDAHYPSSSFPLNAELVKLLVYLEADAVVGRTLTLMKELGPEPIPEWGYLVERSRNYGGTVGRLLNKMPPTRAMHFAFVLRNQVNGWTLEQRREYLRFFVHAAEYPGGNSYGKFLSQIREDALSSCSKEERVLLDDIASVSLFAKPPVVSPPEGPGRAWKRREAEGMVANLSKRNFDRGRNLFHATQCAKCHRLGGEGGAIGPDLSTAGRKYPLPDLLDAIIDPSKAISDQYGSHRVLTLDGNVVTGRMVKIDGQVHIYTADADKPPVVIDEEEIELVAESKISQMPTGLINGLNPEELKDLIAYILSGGNRRDRVYR